MEQERSLYESIGGASTFDLLVKRFYQGVKQDPILLPMYPEDDLEGASRRLSTFLQQYFGGPSTYSETRGHPALRRRHARFKVNPEARDRWLLAMTSALDSLELAPSEYEMMSGYFERAAIAMVNTFEP
tara:strand:+ start:945 stop:1331 length:387 start_codon:yes stop_codon:yes gene_type:complete